MIRSVPAIVCAALLGVVIAAGLFAGADRIAPAPPPADPYGKLPLSFEPNAGRFDRRVDYLARGAGYTVFLTPSEAVVSLRGATVRTSLVGARRDVRPVASKRRSGTLNSFTGSDRSRWRTGIPMWGEVRYRSAYPGVDVVYHGSGRRLEYDFVVRPGADPRRIALRPQGGRVALAGGELVISTPRGEVRHERPVAYQEIAGRRRPVAARWLLAAGVARFALGDYDRSRPLVIDPVLSYSTFLGGTTSEEVNAIAVDSAGNAYIVGHTGSSDFPVPGGADTSYGGGSFDVFVAKLNATGTGLVYGTFIGGSEVDFGMGVAVDSAGAAYVTGTTYSTNFPDTETVTNGSGAGDDSLKGGNDVFVVKLAPAGNALEFATYWGGAGTDTGAAIAYRRDTVNNRDEVHISGSSASTDLPDINAYQAALATGPADGFVTRLHWNGTTLVNAYTSYLGGAGASAGDIAGIDAARGVGVDSNGATFVGGWTRSTSFPTKSSFQLTDPDTTAPSGTFPEDGTDGFVAKFDTTQSGASSLLWSAYLGGSDGDAVNALSVNSSGNVAVVGETRSTNLEGEPDPPAPPFDQTGAVGLDGFVSEVAFDGGSPVLTSYLGGAGTDRATAVASHRAGISSHQAHYVIGETTSTDFPVFNNEPVHGDAASGQNAFVVKWSTGIIGRAIYSTYFGGVNASDFGRGIAADSSGDALIAGFTNLNSDLPTTAGAFRPAPVGGSDGYAARIDIRPPTLTGGPSGDIATDAATFTYTFGTPPELNVKGYECRLDGAAYAACGTGGSGSKSYTSLGQGAHTFDVLMMDAVDARSDPVSRSFTVDTVAPSAPALVAPGEGETVPTSQPSLAWEAASDATTGVTEYRVFVDGALDRTVGPEACASGACGATTAASLGQGGHQWRVDAVDGVGNVASSATRNFVVAVPPTARLVVAPNPALAGRVVTFDGSGSADATHTIARYEWDLDGDGTFERDSGALATTTHAYTSARTLNVGLRVTDTSGQAGTTQSELRVTAGPGAILQFGVSINAGAQFTRDPDVTVTSIFPATTTTLLFSNDGGFFAAREFRAQEKTAWRLDSSGPERLPKTIYVRFLNGPFVSETHQDDIILDETPPKVVQAQLESPPAAAVAAARKRLYRVRIRATDSNSGVARVQIAASRRRPGKLLRYRRRVTVRAAVRLRWARARDRAGNFSRWRRIR